MRFLRLIVFALATGYRLTDVFFTSQILLQLLDTAVFHFCMFFGHPRGVIISNLDFITGSFIPAFSRCYQFCKNSSLEHARFIKFLISFSTTSTVIVGHCEVLRHIYTFWSSTSLTWIILDHIFDNINV